MCLMAFPLNVSRLAFLCVDQSLILNSLNSSSENSWTTGGPGLTVMEKKPVNPKLVLGLTGGPGFTVMEKAGQSQVGRSSEDHSNACESKRSFVALSA